MSLDLGGTTEELVVVKFWIYIEDEPIRFYDRFNIDYDKREVYPSNRKYGIGNVREMVGRSDILERAEVEFGLVIFEMPLASQMERSGRQLYMQVWSLSKIYIWEW